MPFSPHCCFTSKRLTEIACRVVWALRTGVTVLLLVGMLSVSCASTANAIDASGKPAFQATFLQLWNLHNSWTDTQWDALCASLKEMGVREVILQWCLITERPFFWRLTDERREEVPHDLMEPAPAVERVVRAAERAGLQVRFGLTHDPNWWAEITGAPQLVDTYLHRLLQDQTALAATLIERYGKNPAFTGFYVPQELDDKTWLDPAKFNLLTAHLFRLNTYLETLAPGRSTAVSCFFNGYDEPRQVSVFWSRLLIKTRMRGVYVQDGLGTGKLNPEGAILYMTAVAKGAAQAGAHPRAIVETFALTPEPDDEPSETPKDKAFVKSIGPGRATAASKVSAEEIADGVNPHPGFEPASMVRIKKQLAIARAAVGPDIIAFSLPEYATSQSGEKGEALAREYMKYLGTGN